jgi:DNA-binding CsgD family transcriptional regulator
MQSLLQSDYVSVLAAKSREELQDQIVRFTRGLGFQTVTVMAVIDQPLGESEFICIDNAPSAYREILEDLNGAKRDPVMQHCKRKSLPIVWNQSTYIEAGAEDMWEEQARFGYRSGIGFALHMPGGRHFALGVDRDKEFPKDPVEVTRITAAVQLFAVYAQEAAMPLLSPAVVGPDAALTSRELETLRWTIEGKTAWEVGRILGIAENTVVRHTQSATQKLACANKHHAAVKALRTGLIS